MTAADVAAVFPGAEVIEDGSEPEWPRTGCLEALGELVEAAGVMVEWFREHEPGRLDRLGWRRVIAAVEVARRLTEAAPEAELRAAPAVRVGAGPTERSGAQAALPAVETEARYVLDVIAGAGQAGATLDEVHARWEEERGSAPSKNQLQARRWDLAERHDPPWIVPKGWAGPGEELVEDPRRGLVASRRTRAGARAIVWVLSDAGRRALAREVKNVGSLVERRDEALARGPQGFVTVTNKSAKVDKIARAI